MACDLFYHLSFNVARAKAAKIRHRSQKRITTFDSAHPPR
jgi:hypothetical protein